MDVAPKVNDVAELVDIASLLSEAERAQQARTRQFLDEHFRPNIAEWYESAAFPRAFAVELAQLGLYGMTLTGYGCAEASHVSYGVSCMELEAADSALRALVAVQGSLVMNAIDACGSDEQKETWLARLQRGEAIGCFGLSESDAGSDPSNMNTRATRDGGDWILSGTKTWITNGSIADVAIVWAQTEEGTAGFIVPTDAAGFRAVELSGKISSRLAITSQLILDGVHVPDEARPPRARGLRPALSCINEARFGLLFGVMGAARECLQVTRDFAIERVQFGKPLAGFQITQQKLADMSLKLAKGLLLAIHIGRMKEQGTLTPEAISVGKLNNVREALNIARSCRTILGAVGLTLEYPVLRHAVNLEAVLTYEGTDEVHTLVIGEALTGLGAYR